MKLWSAWAACLVIGMGAACGPPPTGAETPSPSPTGATESPAPATGDTAWQAPADLRSEELPAAVPALDVAVHDIPASAVKALPPAPTSCASYRRPAGSDCGSRDAAVGALAAALAKTDPAQRDTALAELDGCSHFPVGVVRGLRIELAPRGCGDALAGDWVKSPPAEIDGAVHDAIVGLAIGAMLSRAATEPPTMKPPYTDKAVKAFIASDVAGWMGKQAAAIEELSRIGVKLRGYGRAVVGVEAGMAEMRFVEVMRGVPIPDEMRNDEGLREAYQLALEEALDPRKRRGRDAALVGLGSLATLGVIRDDRVVLARELIGKMYGGRSIDSLDVLMLPPLAPSEPTTPTDELASRLHTYYASFLIPADTATNAGTLRALINRGVSLPHRIALSKAELSTPARRHYARARLELGQNYWRAVDFDAAIALLRDVPQAEWTEEDKLVFATAKALHGGPASAAEMMVKAPVSDLGIGKHLDGLEAMIDAGGALAGHAAFNAAYIAQLSAPADAPATYWQTVAQRYQKAAEVLADVRHQRDAKARAEEALQTAAAIGK